VAYAAVDLAGRIYESLSSLQVLLVGAGDTIALVGSHLKSAGAQKITIANRSLERGHALAESLQASACLLSDLPDILPSIDIVVSSTASQLPILGKGLIETALRKRRHKPMLLIDIAVPRDVEAEVAELEDVYLYTVDDLRGIVDQNKAQREQEAERAHAILRQEVAAYERLVRADASTELIRCYREQAHELAQAELDRAKKELAAGRDPEQVIEMMTRALTNKLLHAPSRGLKSLAEDDPAQLELAKRLLDLP
jgi:glutamyl-tRNA reductase